MVPVVHIKTWTDKLIYRFFEAPKGLDFACNYYPYEKGSDHMWYERTTKKHLSMLFSRFADKSLPVLDIGCGKGFVLYWLNKLGFSRVDGIECDQAMVAVANRNLAVAGLADQSKVFHVDARAFSGYDDYQVIYMFHPFKERIMRDVVKRLEESLTRAPRQFVVVYFYPVEHRVFDESDLFLLREKHVMYFINTVMDAYYYEFDPAHTARRGGRFRDLLEREMQEGNAK
ncbi:MAG TPA: hypothetical protein DEB31_06450 [Clostridiales bacterium]|nr:hypothetical protein [Clostridiales bacterium]